MHIGVGDKLSVNLSRVGIVGYTKCVVYRFVGLDGEGGFIIKIQGGRFKGGCFWLSGEGLLSSLHGARGHLSLVPVLFLGRKPQGLFEAQCLLYGGIPTTLVFDDSKGSFVGTMSVVHKEEQV